MSKEAKKSPVNSFNDPNVKKYEMMGPFPDMNELQLSIEQRMLKAFLGNNLCLTFLPSNETVQGADIDKIFLPSASAWVDREMAGRVYSERAISEAAKAVVTQPAPVAEGPQTLDEVFADIMAGVDFEPQTAQPLETLAEMNAAGTADHVAW